MKKLNLLTIGTLVLLTAALPLTRASAMGTSTSTETTSEVSPEKIGVPSKSLDKKMEKLTQALTLTAEEQAKIKPILEDETNQVKALRADKTLSKMEHLAKIKAIHVDAKSKIAAVLSADQQKKFAEMGPGHRNSAANKS